MKRTFFFLLISFWIHSLVELDCNLKYFIILYPNLVDKKIIIRGCKRLSILVLLITLFLVSWFIDFGLTYDIKVSYLTHDTPLH